MRRAKKASRALADLDACASTPTLRDAPSCERSCPKAERLPNITGYPLGPGGAMPNLAPLLPASLRAGVHSESMWKCAMRAKGEAAGVNASRSTKKLGVFAPGVIEAWGDIMPKIFGDAAAKGSITLCFAAAWPRHRKVTAMMPC
mmetsp:Transcript_83477/g.232377  ORF Transcript_83477/g.232377 Transcript_83477/m.232377 type:complete len:145 (-) Transcript_83477:9-443(-)